VGGLTKQCRDQAVALYSRAVENVVPVSSCKVAEATKLLENIFRSVNIALVNELKIIYAAMGIDIWEVIEAAKTKPFGFMPFYPGPGLGGHCIPIDPFYLAWKARDFGKPTRFIELAGEINTAMPEYVVKRLSEALNAQRKTLNGSKILLVGLAYKADVDDMRESPTFVLLDLLKNQAAEVAYYDPHIQEIGPTREHAQWRGVRSIDWSETKVKQFDAAIIVTAHTSVDYRSLAKWCTCIIDTRNIYGQIGDTDKSGSAIWKA
jgi:UDP-N-acetyl-D-glucosamine dehydrogenase